MSCGSTATPSTHFPGASTPEIENGVGAAAPIGEIRGGMAREPDQEMIKVLSHPTRLEILMALQDRIASPAELAAEMDQSLGAISYHANTLVRCGWLELVHTEARRGSFEQFFAVSSHSPL
jgi:hypothetical protein